MTLAEILGAPLTRDEAINLIQEDDYAYDEFLDLPEKEREDIVEFIQGIKGLPILYDGFYKHVFDPECNPERLEDFLSELFGESVKIEQVLAKEGNKLVEEGSLVVMDIIVRLSDGSIVDVEMQKYGYHFTGERSSCYLSDMIMRQYNRVKRKKKKNFRFNHMKPVHLVVLLEKSTKEFRDASPSYIHRLENHFDSGVKVNLLSNLTYICLDTFSNVRENINNKMDAWLTFLSSDKAEDIIALVEKYPEFSECYRDIAEFRRNPKELIGMFSKALLEMDRNTVKYMIEEQQKELEAQQKELEENKKELEENKKELEENKKKLEENKKSLNEKDKLIEEMEAKIKALKTALEKETKPRA